jgi:perosamine synthetase
MIRRWKAGMTLSDLVSALKINGETREDLESVVASRAGAAYGVAFSYAHAGFYALIKAMGLSGAEIVIPAYTCKVIADVIIATGNIPVLVDISLHDFNMDLDKLAAAITGRTRMVVATHMFGYITSIHRIREITAGRPITIVEDAVLTYPGTTSSPGGLQSDATIYSFGPGKPTFAIRGGVLVLSDPDLYRRVSEYRRNHMDLLPRREWYKRWALAGIHYLLTKDSVYGLANGLNLSKKSFSATSTSVSALDSAAGSMSPELPADYAVRFADFQARIGLSQLARIDDWLSRRRLQAQRYADALSDIHGLTPAPAIEGSCYSHYTVLVPNRDSIRFRHKMKRLGVEVGATFPYDLSQFSAFRAYCQGTYPNAAKAGKEVVNLPMDYRLTELQTSQTIDRIRQVLRG